MAENKIETQDILRNVQSLLSEHFYVPKYQRGYRWTQKQIDDLLNDIDRFTPSDDESKNSWYCLQPLVVKKGNNNEGWRLIDGQQRLTSIKLILHYLNKIFFYANPKQLYFIDYETRGKDADWLAIVEDEVKSDKYIDYAHIYLAYQAIKEWFDKKGGGYDAYKFNSKLLSNCKFIWYDIDQNGHNNDKEEEVFIRLNDGKILLTQSELIKALFLNSSNFVKEKNEEEIRLRQLEISTQWDNIEQELVDDELWYFINGKENPVRPRIEYLFDVIANKPQNSDDKEFTFRYFANKFEKNELKSGDKAEFVKREWEIIWNTYLIFKEWFNDKYYFHLIGYLLCLNEVSNLLKEYRNNDKETFKNELVKKIKSSINWNGIDEVKYNDGRARKILLLHNVVTMQQQADKTSRFSFFQYIGTKNKKGWDIEHIQAIAEESPKSEQHRKDFVTEIKSIITDDILKTELENFSDWTDDKEFDAMRVKINHYFEINSGLLDENLLDNLALLDAGTNRGYGNEYYPIKRKTILKNDKKGDFIPFCTKKVFLKYYTQEVENVTFWTGNDRNAYLTDIKEKLSPYFI